MQIQGVGGETLAAGVSLLIEGKFGLVTGAAGGMGRAAALLFAREGASVACAGPNLVRVAQVASEIGDCGGHAIPIKLDVRDRDSCQAAVRVAAEKFGRIDFLANFAGVWDGRDTEQVENADWNEIVDVNLKGSFLICQAVTPRMTAQRSGRIVLIGSIAARVGGRMGGPHYAASKGGVNSLARALARRLGPYNVTVNSVNPGAVETEMIASWPTEAKTKMIEQTALGRLGQPNDIAAVTLFLVSDLSQWITGETIEANGGAYFG
jgi:3-oxoacyl-[acyl-carrier protein] reductase